ncbi:hypothetical protein [Streptomyces sp. 4N124]|uniref:hypothetical protein n=1 Tax=Streptomyces sp. 4N124 TaxID=3457420 RepID=UPI003FD0C633
MWEQVDAEVARLAVRDRLRWSKARFGRRAGALVLQIEGDDGSWLNRCLDLCQGALPVGVARAATDGMDDEQQVVALLRAMTDGCGFEGRPPFALPVVFPRFAAARTALYGWRPTDGQSPQEQLSDLVRTVKDAIARARALTKPTAHARMDEFVHSPYVGGLFNGLVGAGLDLVHVVRFPHRRTMRWFRRTVRLRNAWTDAGVCHALLEAWREWTPEQKQDLLVEALLADIAAHYGFWRRLNRVRRPVFFVPDVDTHPARRAVRDRLLAAFDGGSRNLRAYPVVITTAQPGAATPADGACPAVRPDRLAREIPARFQERKRVGEWRIHGSNEPLPSRVVQVDLRSVPEQRPVVSGSRP